MTQAQLKPDAARRGIRTGAQGLSVEAVLQLLEAFGLFTLSADQHAAVLVVGIPLVSFALAFAECRGWIRDTRRKS